MRLLSTVYQRFAQLIHELAKFGVVGAVAYVTQLVATNVFWYALGLPELVGQALGTVCATVVAFLGNRFWTFRHRSHGHLLWSYVMFFGLNAVGLGIRSPACGSRSRSSGWTARWHGTSQAMWWGWAWAPCSGSGATAGGCSAPRTGCLPQKRSRVALFTQFFVKRFLLTFDKANNKGLFAQ